mmetsp:Transcript_41975/g.67518  ORF Transcript_41975/g.67518 Transcript_41975/m.67518 type:complete len:89 (-) Transcript_41975:38-304(-)
MTLAEIIIIITIIAMTFTFGNATSSGGQGLLACPRSHCCRRDMCAASPDENGKFAKSKRQLPFFGIYPPNVEGQPNSLIDNTLMTSKC